MTVVVVVVVGFKGVGKSLFCLLLVGYQVLIGVYCTYHN